MLAWTMWCLISSRNKRFSIFFKMSRLALGCISNLFNRYWGTASLMSKATTTHHSPPSSAKVKNEWNYISTPTACLHGMQRDKITCICVLYDASILNYFCKTKCAAYFNSA